jgi:hypothetical protein
LSFNAKNYLKTLIPSFIIMMAFSYGMATGNALVQWGGFLLVFGAQMGWQLYKGAKSGPAMDANMKEAYRAKRSKVLQYVSERDVRAAQVAGGSSGQMSQSVRMMGGLLVPLIVFFGTTYFIIPAFWHDVLPWQSYVVGFLASMPFSAIFMIKSGLPQGAPQITPSTYVVTERGIVFDQMGRSIIVKFPLTKAEKGKGNCVEVEGIKEGQLIPNRLKLYTDKADELLRILRPRVRSEVSP